MAAVFWFPWLYTVAQFMIFWVAGHRRGPADRELVVRAQLPRPVVHARSAVGTAYYLIPKIIGRPVHSYYLSIIGFWSLALFYSWAGMHHLIGGPIPAWLATASTVGSMMMFIPGHRGGASTTT